MPIWRKASDQRPAKGDVDLILKIEGKYNIGRYVKEYDYFKMEPDFGHMFWPRDVEYLDESQDSFTINDLRIAYDSGWNVGAGDYGAFHLFIKEQYNIDL